jgi:hypothetical protein
METPSNTTAHTPYTPRSTADMYGHRMPLYPAFRLGSGAGIHLLSALGGHQWEGQVLDLGLAPPVPLESPSADPVGAGPRSGVTGSAEGPRRLRKEDGSSSRFNPRLLPSDQPQDKLTPGMPPESPGRVVGILTQQGASNGGLNNDYPIINFVNNTVKKHRYLSLFLCNMMTARSAGLVFARETIVT